MTEHDAEATLQAGAQTDPEVVETPRLALTILHHPDPARIGDIAFAGPRCELSRLSPSFHPPVGGAGAPLGDRHLSRRPIVITEIATPGARIDPARSGSEIATDGRAATGAVELSAVELARGVTLELAGRIALLVHVRRRPQPGVSRHGLIGHSEAIEAACAHVDRVADLGVPVLLTGPTGSGKELIARAIHDAGPRRSGPFVAVSAAALPPTTAASLLFGHVRGAFTGADRSHPGLFVAADGGTLFLDEIGETPAELQAMLLRAIEERAVMPVGATTVRPVDVRLVTATDADLDREAAEGRFKLPLLHRLAGFRIQLPSLADRRDDVGRLLVRFLRDELAAAGEPDRLAGGADRPPWLPPSVVAALARHTWPGNVRELRNVARHIVIANRGRATLVVDEFLGSLIAASPSAPQAAPARSWTARRPSEISEEELTSALRENRWRTGATAAALGISRTSLYTLMERSEQLRKGRDLSREEIEAAHRDAGGDPELMAERLEVSERALKLRIRELQISWPDEQVEP